MLILRNGQRYFGRFIERRRDSVVISGEAAGEVQVPVSSIRAMSIFRGHDLPPGSWDLDHSATHENQISKVTKAQV